MKPAPPRHRPFSQRLAVRRAWLATSLLVFLLATASAGAWAAAQPGSSVEEVDAAIQSYMERNRIPGLAWAVTRGGQVVHARGFGTAGAGRPMTADTPMLIGSQTKSFTALAVMQLAEAGQLELGVPVQRYIPWFKVADAQASGQITIRSLLNHSSGLAEAGYVPNLPDSASIEAAVRDLQRARPAARVGEKFQYFNPGYIVLGYLVETLSGQSYGDYLRQHIFEPLGMANSSASPAEYAGMGLAQGYSQLFAFPVAMSQRIPAYYMPAGFIVSTASDMARYLMAMENGGELDGVRILSAAGVRTMLTPNRAIQSYAGFGWDIFSYYGEPQMIHGGATERYYTQVVILPQSDFTAVMLINQDHMFKASYDYPALFWGAVDRLMGRPVTQQGISSVSIGWGLALAFLGILIIEARGLLALRKEPARLAELAPTRRWLRLLPHALWSAATLLIVTVIGPALAGRSFDLRWFTGFYPDVALLAGMVLAAEAIQALVKTGLILSRKSA